jgi:hypothetical protein
MTLHPFVAFSEYYCKGSRHWFWKPKESFYYSVVRNGQDLHLQLATLTEWYPFGRRGCGEGSFRIPGFKINWA